MKITLLLKNLNGIVISKIVNSNHKVSEHFTASEFLTNKDDKLDLACASQYDVDTLEYIRTLYGIGITITSAGRTPEYNEKIGGALNSNHQFLFDCLDFIIKDATTLQANNIFSYLKLRGYTGIGRYKGNRFHIDIGYRDKFTTWEG